ncbi:MAG: ATP-dependent RecD-like DNA helicase [Planctomycetota bacterium]
MSGGLFPEPESNTLSGTVSREVYRNAAGTFAVVRLETQRGYEATVTGPLPPVEPGETLEARGEWTDDPRHGRQFQARSAQVKPPGTTSAVERFLGTGSIEGVGPELARRIVETFADETLRVLDEQPHRLREVRGIGAKKAERISASWAAQQASRETMLFLRGHGLGPVLAQRVFTRFGAETRRALEEDPYVLAREVEGAGFLTADRLARALGFAPDDPRRLRAGLLWVADEALAQGSTAVLADELIERAARELGAERDPLERALEEARRDLALELDRPEDEDVIYLPRVLRAERQAARRTLALIDPQTPRRLPELDVPRALQWLEEHADLSLTEAQAQAVGAALSHSLAIVTGGPGTGKTTIVRALVRLLRERGIAFALAAPTGRAAKRLEEATGAPGSTLHRLLEWDPRGGGFGRDADQPLDADLVVVDEASMLDQALYAALLRALPVGATLVLIGDVDQLPSVGAGNVLADLIASGAAEVVRLWEVFRQAAASRIVLAAHEVNQGRVPDLAVADAHADFFFVERDDPEAARRTIVTLVQERIPQAFRLDPVRDVQVLAPMHRGTCGTEELNRALKEALTGQGGDELGVGDKVMQLKNDYEHEVFNGDVGRVLGLDEGSGAVLVDFGGKEVLVPRSERSRLALAYCATVHKAQGSEYPAVVLPLLTEHYVMLQRNLLYTGLTRARRLAVLVGSRRAIELAVQNDRPARRRTYLGTRVRRGWSGAEA